MGAKMPGRKSAKSHVVAKSKRGRIDEARMFVPFGVLPRFPLLCRCNLKLFRASLPGCNDFPRKVCLESNKALLRDLVFLGAPDNVCRYWSAKIDVQLVETPPSLYSANIIRSGSCPGLIVAVKRLPVLRIIKETLIAIIPHERPAWDPFVALVIPKALCASSLRPSGNFCTFLKVFKYPHT